MADLFQQKQSGKRTAVSKLTPAGESELSSDGEQEWSYTC